MNVPICGAYLSLFKILHKYSTFAEDHPKDPCEPRYEIWELDYFMEIFMAYEHTMFSDLLPQSHVYTAPPSSRWQEGHACSQKRSILSYLSARPLCMIMKCWGFSLDSTWNIWHLKGTGFLNFNTSLFYTTRKIYSIYSIVLFIPHTHHLVKLQYVGISP